ncbi:MAG: hypothetical protein JSV03_04095 [Planctomycetota bacterium]|nr:MAG: hypothetical protein JSV03_04095 [Planctomycetota bacterium]
MMDERIQTTMNRIATRGFWIWYVLMLISLCCRTLILKQHPRDYWDILAILLIGSLYVFIAAANKGFFSVYEHEFTRRSLAVCIPSAIIIAAAILAIFAWQFPTPGMNSIVDVGMFVIVLLPGVGLWIGIAYFIHRRWTRKEGIEDEK